MKSAINQKALFKKSIRWKGLDSGEDIYAPKDFSSSLAKDFGPLCSSLASEGVETRTMRFMNQNHVMLRVYIWNYILIIHIDLKMNSGQNGGNSEQKSKKKTFVNSQILSLTTQNDLGELVPPLTLTFGHITNVRYQKLFSTSDVWHMLSLCLSYSSIDISGPHM